MAGEARGTPISKLGRLFLVDHMCVLPYGHNLNAIVLFEDVLKGNFSSSICLVGRDLPEYSELAHRVKRELKYPYGGFVERSPAKPTQRISAAQARLSVLLRRALYTGCYEVLGIDLVRDRIRRDWRGVFKRHSIGESDAIFFPSADFYGCTALLDFISGLPPARRPKVHLRLIGVSENARYSRSAARPAFVGTIRGALAAGVRLTLSAETPVYAAYVERLIGEPVAYLPYPLDNPLQPIHWNAVKTLASPGQGRADKGFHRLFPIIANLERNKPGAFQYDVQNMREADPQYRPRYVSTLENVPNMKLRPARLKQAEIDAVYAAADILLLPYDSGTYAMRGSAVYQEGVAAGRPVVCSKGLGLSDLVLRYGNGLLAESDDDFADKIQQLASCSKEQIKDMVKRGRAAYESDFNNGLRRVLEGLTS